MKRILILGPINTGSNLIQKLLESIPGVYIIKNLERYHHLIWKHRLKYLEEYISRLSKDITIIICYRPLISWLGSVEKTPYYISHHSYRTNYLDISKPITFTPTYLKFHNKPSYRNPILLYNEFYQVYSKIIKKYPNNIVINYAKLIDADGLNYFNTKISKIDIQLNVSKGKNILARPSKKTKCVRNIIEAREKYQKTQKTIMRKIKNQKLYSYIDNKLNRYYSKL